jgi:peptidoglycan/LPS O-acetylase OafA/YrhL
MSHRSHYRPDIDGLRAVAVAVVIAYHGFHQWLPGGFVGVDVFFVISGYLISGIILGGLAERRFTFTDFYARRIRRIFPALAIVLDAVAAAGWFTMYADDYERLGRHIAAGAGFAANFVLWQESSYFDTAVELKPLLHLWSLGIEEQFYLAWPMLLVLASRRRRGPLLLTLAIGTASLLISIWQVRIDRTPAFFSPWTRFWELLAGATLACIEIDRAWKGRLDRLLAVRWLPDTLAIAGAAMIGTGVILIDATRVFPGLWVLLPVGGTFALLVAGPRAWINRSLLSLPPVVWIGLISYPLYLWHWPLLSFARIVNGGTPPGVVRLGLIALSVVLAWLTYRLIEWPVRFGSRRRKVVPALATAMVMLFALGLSADAAAGFVNRPINRSDAAHLVEFYERMRRGGLRAAYRQECDFMDWITESARDALDPSCTAAGGEATVLLWGDSFAQALSQGIRDQLPAGTTLAQVTTSACAAAIDNFDPVPPGRRCEKANRYAMDAIARLRPTLVILAQAGAHGATDWPRIAGRALELGAGHVMVVGPFPLWNPGLPRVFADHHLEDRAHYVSAGLDQGLFAIDRELASKLSAAPNITYLSLLEPLCRDHACLARVPGEGALDLMALDFGHLTPKGSSYVGRAVFRPSFERLGIR